ncbi:helix-turn-helix domain-containing protein [Methanomassiliicoccus luminyensis]|jgi:hypothetical protein|uniref:helix-turn-helix domain-containing protein n=1 Tax=Methanomassiliicoccus luminyensis TaxID=1080712 RepID=UPI0003677DA8|nr:helix-turn-helix domain-containing protein [Methanomassiliicoccus luminyensis]
MTYIIVSIGIKHRDCWHANLSRALEATIIINYVYTLPNGQLYSNQTIMCKRTEEIEPLLRQMPEVQKFLTLSRSHGKAEVITWAEQSSVMDIITRANCVFVGPIVVENGVENWHVIAPTQKELQEAIHDLEQCADIAYIRHGYMSIHKNDLTERQLVALQAATEMGYFDTPRRASIREVAARMRISTSTASEHLRKAEEKILKGHVQEVMRFR